MRVNVHWLVLFVAVSGHIGLSTKEVAAQSAYCAVSGLALSAEREGDGGVDRVARECKAGDIIDIPAGHVLAVRLLCDFTKTISAQGREIICVMISPPRKRR